MRKSKLTLFGFTIGLLSSCSSLAQSELESGLVNISAEDVLAINWSSPPGGESSTHLKLQNEKEVERFAKWANENTSGWLPLDRPMIPEMVFGGEGFYYDFHQEDGIVFRSLWGTEDHTASYLRVDLSGLSFVNPESFSVVDN